ncbi:aldo/keto reductase [Schlesneria sp. DSM 10557]|uniref:aldo/keto reductase n=1 Tax=Schlesneria sp. DSM 10557 TaxID=3044399 RepID=UPI0035A02000
MELRQIGRTEILVTPLAMGCWPIAGVTSVGVTDEQSLATLQAAVDGGLNFFDTAYCYGYDGESEKLIRRALGHRRDELVIATKGGIHYENRVQVKDARPATLERECEESLQRLGTDYIDLYYLHAPDPNTPVEESAGALKGLLQSGKVRSIGVSNFSLQQLIAFQAVCPLAAYQPHYNMLQREIEESQLPWCIENHVSAIVYWPLMKGLLAGKLPRDHQFDPKDGRPKYPMFSGDEWNKNQDFLDRLRPIAEECQSTVAQLVLNWTIQRPGITVALCGAKRPDQIRDNAAALTWTLTAEQISRIDQAIQDRGAAASRAAV